MLGFIATAYAQDIVMPAIPIGVTPFQSWVMTVASAMLPVLLGLLVWFVKQKFSSDTSARYGDKLTGAAANGAKLGAIKGTSREDAVAIGVNYIKNGYAPEIAATPAATDQHLADMVLAQLPVAAKSEVRANAQQPVGRAPMPIPTMPQGRVIP